MAQTRLAMGGRDKLIKNSTALMRMLSTAC